MLFTIIRIRRFCVVIAFLSAIGNPVYAQLTPPPVPPENPTTEAKRILGKILFWDEQVSSDDTVACGTCHIPAVAGSDPRFGHHPGPDAQFLTADDTIGSPGIAARDAQNNKVTDPVFGDSLQVTSRASPGIYMSMYADDTFWDGRARARFEDPQNPGATIINDGGGLESQAVVPILSGVEMAHQDRIWTDVTLKLMSAIPMALASRLPADMSARLAGNPSYSDLFSDAFGDPAITPARIALAIAAYERTLVPDQTPWDRFMNGESDAMTPQQVAGWSSFEQDTVCDNCHTPPEFTDHQFYNIGLRPAAEDAGRQNVTLAGNDFGRFKTPSLRNIGLRTSLSHVGWLTGLQDTADFYNASAENNRHTQFTDFQSDAPAPNGGPTVAYALVTFLAGDAAAQAPVLDFLENALTDPRVATESFPFDRPLLHSETIALLSYNVAGADTNIQRAERLSSIIRAQDADIVGLQQADGAILDELATLLADQFDVVTFPVGSPGEPILLRRGKFTLVEVGSAAALLTCSGHEFVNYVVLEYISSGEIVTLHNNYFCPPDTMFPAGETSGQLRNEAQSVLLAETMLQNQVMWNAPGIAIGDFQATSTSGTVQFLLNGASHAFADTNPVSLRDALLSVSPASPDPTNTQWSFVTESVTGVTILAATVVSNGDTILAASQEPVLVAVAIDTTPGNIKPRPGDLTDDSSPTAPGDFVATAQTESSIQLNWSAAMDNTGVSRYRLYRDNKLAATTTSTTYFDANLLRNSSYAYAVTAIDNAGNESLPANLTATTAGALPPPGAPPSGSSGGGQLHFAALILLFLTNLLRLFTTRRPATSY